MTDQELKDLVASLSVVQAESAEHIRRVSEENRRSRVEVDEHLNRVSEENRRSRMEIDEHLNRMSERISLAQEETGEQIKQMSKRLGIAQEETDKQIKQVNKQIGEIGNKFGYFTEGMALPSMEKVLKRQFGLNGVFPRAKLDRNGETLEIDVLAYDTMGESDSVFLVEVKSNLTREAIEQLLDAIERFPKFYPDLADRKLFGIVAAVYIPDELRNTVFKKGLYLARISDDTFKLQTPAGFKPKVFGGNGYKTNGGRRAKKSK